MLLEADGIQKSYDGVKALTSVSLDLRAGEVHALVGENGAGKSTLMKVLTGAVQPDGGEIRLHGQRIEHNHPAKARELGIPPSISSLLFSRILASRRISRLRMTAISCGR